MRVRGGKVQLQDHGAGLQAGRCTACVTHAVHPWRYMGAAAACGEEQIREVPSASYQSEEDKSLNDTVKAIEAKESGKVARKAVGVTHTQGRGIQGQHKG